MHKVLIFLPTPDLSVQGTSSSSVVPALNSPNNGEQNVFIIYNTFATCNHFILYNLFVFLKVASKLWPEHRPVWALEFAGLAGRICDLQAEQKCLLCSLEVNRTFAVSHMYCDSVFSSDSSSDTQWKRVDVRRWWKWSRWIKSGEKTN